MGMYEKDGEKYFVMDGHVHYWDASPENWVEGQEQYAKGWIECFYGYHQLGPEEYYWPMQKFQKYSEETMMKDLPPYLPQGVVQGRLQHHRSGCHLGGKVPRQVHPEWPL